jgi:hypothetical protein
MPPQKFTGYSVSFSEEQYAIYARDILRSALVMSSARGMLDYITKIDSMGDYSFKSRIREIKTYLLDADKYDSKIALNFATLMIKELSEVRFTYTANDPVGYDGINEDPAGNWGDSHQDPAGNWGDGGTSSGSYGNSDAGNWGDGGNSSNSGAGNWGDTQSTSNSVETRYGRRVYDRVAQGTAYDQKSGRISKSSSIEDQVRKDRAVLQGRVNGIRNIVWIFKDSGGKCGPTESVEVLLNSAGIQIDTKDCRSGNSSGGGFYDSDAGNW